jgi:CubicO group peptidase (beta-lactamase class C family)
MTKSVFNALVGVAVKEGKLAVNEPVRVSQWSTPGDLRARISVNDLLHMSSGLAFNESQAGLSSDVLQMLFREPNMASFAANKSAEVTPGSRWRYSSGAVMVLSRVLRDALGDETYGEFPRVALFDPLGMTHAVIETDASGNFVASSYMYATAREWARFGQLYLRDGVWKGQRILPEGWVTYTRTPAPAAPPSTYGALFWLSTPAEYRGRRATVPTDAFHAVGHEGQFVTIIPSEDVVIVRLGRTRRPSAWEHDRFVANILAALHS